MRSDSNSHRPSASRVEFQSRTPLLKLASWVPLSLIVIALARWWLDVPRSMVSETAQQVSFAPRAAGTTSATPAARAPAPRTTSDVDWVVSGQVSSATGGVIENAHVCAMSSAASCCSPAVCVMTDRAGRFSLHTSSTPAWVLASAAGFVSARHELDGPQRGPTRAFDDVSLRLTRAAESSRVSGLVLDATGGPIPEALVVASQRANASSPSASTRSNEGGYFELNVDSGDTLLVAEADGYSRATRSVAAPAQNVRLLLVPSSSIHGRVIARTTGERVAFASVTAGNLNGVLLQSTEARTGPDGMFELDRLPTGGYSLWVRADGWEDARVWVSLGLGEHVEDIEVGLEPAATLAATVLVDGVPCAEASVMLLGANAFSGIADATGSLQLTNLTPGDYEAAVSCAAGSPISERLSISPRERLIRRWDLEPGGRVTGVALRASGAPLAGVLVTVTHVEGDEAQAAPSEAAGPSIGMSCTTDGAGAFACAGLPRGVYDVSLASDLDERSPTARVVVAPGADAHVVLTAHALGSIRARARGNGGMGRASVLALRRGESVPSVAREDGERLVLSEIPLGSYSVYRATQPERTVQVELTRDGQIVDVELPPLPLRSISGRVVDVHDVAVPDAWVRASSDEDPGGSAGSLATLTNEQGEFELEGLADGAYTLSASNPQGEVTASSVAAGSRGVHLQLPAFGSLSGTVQTAEGEPVSTFALSYTHENGEGGTVTGRDGRWSIDWLGPGRYALDVDSASGRAHGNAELSRSGGRVEVEMVVTSDRPQASAAP